MSPTRGHPIWTPQDLPSWAPWDLPSWAPPGPSLLDPPRAIPPGPPGAIPSGPLRTIPPGTPQGHPARLGPHRAGGDPVPTDGSGSRVKPGGVSPWHPRPHPYATGSEPAAGRWLRHGAPRM